MKTLLSAWITLLILAVHVPANAMFYRAVGGKPDVVFPRGFLPWGTNPNLFQHIAGMSCNRRTVAEANEDVEGSRYTSLAATREAAILVARGRLAQATPTVANPEPTIWIYEIRPTDTVYNAALTFERAGVNLNAGPMRVPYQNVLVLEEWDDIGPILPERIREARQYRLVNGQAVEIPNTAVTNPLYVDRPTTANPNPLPPSVITGVETGRQRARTVIGAAATGLISACWCDTARRGPTRRWLDTVELVDPSSDACLSRVMQFNDVVPSVRYFPADGWKVEF